MTPATLRATLSELGWSLRHLARVLCRPTGTVTNWTRDRYSVPPDVAEWLLRRVALHQAWMRADPPPNTKHGRD